MSCPNPDADTPCRYCDSSKVTDHAWRICLQECSKCFVHGRIAGQAITYFTCGFCDKEYYHPNTAVPSYCQLCCKERDICCRCGKDMD